ncbi:Hypothetical_protein [Hexamita inflata]|uniref:Hypothetical_protein n=1 Tax=Hexamita inflata TaxID=28002 RepID=A0AA86PPF0_9EUKA|nr:Hypothetical protein HINF_LOCUS31384 [Hexamita inflata]
MRKSKSKKSVLSVSKKRCNSPQNQSISVQTDTDCKYEVVNSIKSYCNEPQIVFSAPSHVKDNFNVLNTFISHKAAPKRITASHIDSMLWNKSQSQSEPSQSSIITQSYSYTLGTEIQDQIQRMLPIFDTSSFQFSQNPEKLNSNTQDQISKVDLDLTASCSISDENDQILSCTRTPSAPQENIIQNASRTSFYNSERVPKNLKTDLVPFTTPHILTQKTQRLMETKTQQKKIETEQQKENGKRKVETVQKREQINSQKQNIIKQETCKQKTVESKCKTNLQKTNQKQKQIEDTQEIIEINRYQRKEQRDALDFNIDDSVTLYASRGRVL